MIITVTNETINITYLKKEDHLNELLSMLIGNLPGLTGVSNVLVCIADCVS